MTSDEERKRASEAPRRVNGASADEIEAFNRDLETLIRRSVESSFEFADWSSLTSQFEPVRCREITGCTKRSCPAYDGSDYRCWLMVGTFCGGSVQGEFAKKYRTCFECPVFGRIAEQPLRRLYENVTTLLFSLRDKVAKLHELAIRDPLTGLYNRHFFNEVVEQQAALCDRNGEDLSFIVIDLDGFKQINDDHGHLAGDSVLIEAAGLITKTVRKSDLAFRFGGDEFLVLMANADSAKSMHMVCRLQEAVDDWNRTWSNHFCCEISFSMGCSTRARDGDIRAALKEADELMYLRKNEKRPPAAG